MFDVGRSFCEISLQFAKKYGNFVILNADSSKDFDLARFQSFFPDRILNFGLGQRDMLAAASGFSVGGKVPFVTGLSSMLIEKGFDQIKNNICRSNLNIKICGIVDDLYGDDLAVLNAVPNLKIVIPADVYEFKSVMEAMIVNYGPTYVRLSRKLSDEVYGSVPNFQFGEVDVLKSGADLAIFAHGNMVKVALEVAEILQKEGINISVVNVSSIKPINEEKIVDLVKGVRFVLTLEQHCKRGGLHSLISSVCAERWPMPVKGIGFGDEFVDSGSSEEWYEKWGLDVDGVLERVKMMMKVF